MFGDSLSDTGNLASVFVNFPPFQPFPTFPFFMGRISNGPVGVEILAERIDLTAGPSLHLTFLPVGSNFAVAGARARVISPALIDISLATQITAFLDNQIGPAPPGALYVIFIGGNDLRDARDVLSRAEAKAIVRDAAEKVREAIEDLAEAGAHTFLLVNSPNIGAIPETRLIAGATDNPKLIKRARRVSKLYREELEDIAEQLEDENEIEIVEFDLFKFFKNLLRKADHLEFTNTTDACFSSITFSFHPDCAFGANFDQFIFFDEIHPTTRVHALVGEAMFEELEVDNDDDDDGHHDDDHDD